MSEQTEITQEGLQFKRQCAELQQRIDTNTTPEYASILANIRNIMQQDPTVVTFATDEEIGAIVKGLAAQKGITLEAKGSTKKQSAGGVTSTKALKNATLDDI